MNPVVHFEMPAEDRNGVAAFYQSAFGWKFQMLGEDMGNYAIATTSEADESGRPKNPGMINGGFFRTSKDKPAQYPSVVIAVDDIRASMKKVTEAGGKVLGEPDDMTPMKTPPIVSQQEWEAARQQLLVKEKALTRSRDALAAERRRMPWMAVEKKYEFEGLQGKVRLLDLFEGRSQLIVYRAFFEPGVFGWPEHACRGCSLLSDQVGHLAHLHARDTTLAYASRAPQADIARLKARMGWEMPWYTITDSFDKDFGVDEWHGHNVFFRYGERVFRTYFINNRFDEAMGTIWSYLDITPLGRQETWEDSPEGYTQTPPYEWWNWHDNYDAENAPNPKWIDIITDPEGAALRRREEEAKAS